MKLKLTCPSITHQFAVEAMSPFGVVISPQTAGTEITELSVPMVRTLARQQHLLVLRGFDPLPGPDSLTDYAAAWGQLLSWPFGVVLDLVEHEHPADHVFDNTGVSLHWDGMFVDWIPEFQIFHCVNATGEGQGGRTVFCDTTRVLADASSETRRLWAGLTLTYQVAHASHYGGTTVSPLVIGHPGSGFPVMRYLEPVPGHTHYPNRPTVEFHDVPAARSAEIEQALRDTLYDPRHCYAHSWQTGDVVIADNYTLLHGREPFTSGCGRHVRRVHVLGDPPLKNHALRRPA